MLVVDINALLAVHFLNFRSDVGADALAAVHIVINSADSEHIVRVQCTGSELLSLVNMIPVMHKDTG